ncbi:uncharacterized protein LOC127262138 [Andrographis paniculata]|uniref:uncharacterized protein LOC127262138 n=1 Tax=Andrographis paniculata TaxID=175694 RepID=UPI0021E8B198|nr:uncharacterized protein LOC127262138 [Andrographis paniculata]XP_051146632.1 uncharacterized protein LOC127262138 [Andrographis paniculata]
MDLGCIDMGCIEKPSKETSMEKDSSEEEASATKPLKINKAKDAMRSSISALNKLTSQITKPTHRKTSSPLNWFPRKKVEPYLKRKIKMLQQVDGMNTTLDETLGDSNPHYSRVLLEKIAIREAAEKAMMARKAAMVEASWCRILQAARIETKEAEDQLSKADLAATEAFEAARAIGVIMNDISDSALQNQSKTETLAAGDLTVNTVSATFETAFEVDRQVAAAVKAAFIKLASCPPINHDDFKELLHRISENPDSSSSIVVTSDRESESDVVTDDAAGPCKKRRELNEFGMDNLVDMMLGRLRCLKEDELASLATIVATSGLNAVLSEMGNGKRHDLSSGVENTEDTNGLKPTRRASVIRRASRASLAQGGSANGELPSLDKFLVKRLTRLERELLEAKNARKNEHSNDNLSSIENSSEVKELEEAKRRNGALSETDNSRLCRARQEAEEEVPSLDKVLVKRITRLEREVQEARKHDKENMDVNKTRAARSHEAEPYESLDKVLTKRVSRLEKEQQEFRPDTMPRNNPKRKETHRDMDEEGGLDQVLSVKHKCRLEREKTAAAVSMMLQEEDSATTGHSMSRRRQAREKELQAAWGGLSLGNSMMMPPHVSRLQREKAAWLEAEEDEKKKIGNNGRIVR